MPIASTVKQFVTALQTSQSKTTKALDQILQSPASPRGTADFTALQQTDALARPLASWARSRLQAEGLGTKELNHVNKWPDAQKKRLRKLLVRAVTNGRRVSFFWSLHGGASEETDKPSSLPSSGTVKVTFKSPHPRVRISTAAGTFGHIITDVG